MMFKSSILLSLAVTAFSQSLTSVLAGNSQLTSLVSLIQGDPALASALGSLTNVTILAPNNAALASLVNASLPAGAVTALLQYHVLQGTYNAAQVTNTSAFIPTLLQNQTYANVTGGQRVNVVRADGGVSVISGLLNNSTVVQADQNFTGGTIHVINKALTIPTSLSDTLVAARLTSLYGALNATNLLGAAGGLRDVTIFAPNNSAFANIANLAANLSTADATSLLTYHVVNGTVGYSTGLADNQTLTSLNGASLTIHKRGSAIFVNGARVIVPNVLVAGGVVHVIDQVLNPANTTAPGASATAGAVAFSGASSASNIPFTSGVPSATNSLGGAATNTRSSSSSSSGAAMPMKTGAVGAAALFGAGAVFLNF